MAIKAKRVKMPGGNGKAAKAKSGKAKVKREQNLDCLCGCGGKTASYFVPGHDARFKGWLSKIAKGEVKPSDVMPATLRNSLGPWKTKGDGQIPSKSYRELREL